MAKENVSPEERLFKVIQEEKSSASERNDSQETKKGGMEKLKKLFSQFTLHPFPTAQKPLFSFPSPINLHDIDLQIINKGLFIAVVFFAVFVIYYGLSRQYSVEGFVQRVSKIQVYKARSKPIQKFKPVATYLKQIETRDIFNPVPLGEAKQETSYVQVKQAADKLKAMIRNLKLVGISWGKTPRVMIRDEKEQNTYFLTRGQVIGATGIRVRAIFKDKVVIEYEGAEMEMF